MPTFESLKSEYASLWVGMKIRPEYAETVDSIVRKLAANRDRYMAAQKLTGVPWAVISALHNLESGADFETQMGQGDPLDEVSVNVPAGRGPFDTWEESAVDALVTLKHLDQVKDWSPARICYEVERYNGFGYRNNHPEVKSPYLWSFTHHYGRGKYVSDGVWDPSAVSKQCGAIAIIKSLMAMEVPARPPVPVQPPVTQPSTQTVGWFAKLVAAIAAMFGRAPAAPGGKIVLVFSQILKSGAKGEPVLLLQKRLHQLGFSDLNIDGEFGEVTTKAVKEFQLAKNLDPDGEVGELTVLELNAATSTSQKPPLNPPPVKSGEPPPWYTAAEKWIGWKEVGNNGGIEEFIKGGKCGSPRDPYCAIFENFVIETSGFPGTRSAMARSFETSSNFINLGQPALGAIVTMWRVSEKSGSGHVFLYDGENDKGVRGIGANESDMIKRSFHDRSRIVAGFWWPKSAPRPAKLGKILVNDLTTGTTGGET